MRPHRTAAVSRPHGAVASATVETPLGCRAVTLAGDVRRRLQRTPPSPPRHGSTPRAATFLASPDEPLPDRPRRRRRRLASAAAPCSASTTAASAGTQMHDDEQRRRGRLRQPRSLTVDGLRVDNVTDGVRPQQRRRLHDPQHAAQLRARRLRRERPPPRRPGRRLAVRRLLRRRSAPARRQTIIANGCERRRPTCGASGTRSSVSSPCPVPTAAPPTGSATAASSSGTGGTTRRPACRPSWRCTATSSWPSGSGERGPRAWASRPDAWSSCSNNVMVWLGPAAFPTTLPARASRSRGPQRVGRRGGRLDAPSPAGQAVAAFRS